MVKLSSALHIVIMASVIQLSLQSSEIHCHDNCMQENDDKCESRGGKCQPWSEPCLQSHWYPGLCGTPANVDTCCIPGGFQLDWVWSWIKCGRCKNLIVAMANSTTPMADSTTPMANSTTPAPSTTTSVNP